MVVAVIAIATGLVFADTAESQLVSMNNLSEEVNFTAKLHFSSSMDNHAAMEITNYGKEKITIAAQAHYMDNVGSAGSWDCKLDEDAVIPPGKTRTVNFYIEKPAAHGENSILAFFFQYGGEWYLGKVGEKNGIEFYLQHI